MASVGPSLATSSFSWWFIMPNQTGIGFARIGLACLVIGLAY
jgi:hypothetical protein